MNLSPTNDHTANHQFDQMGKLATGFCRESVAKLSEIMIQQILAFSSRWIQNGRHSLKLFAERCAAN